MTLSIGHQSFPRFTNTPTNIRQHCGDRSGPVVGAYAAARLIDKPEEEIRFTFARHNGTRWEELRHVLHLGFEWDTYEKDAVNLRRNFGAPIDAAGSEMIVSCAVMGERTTFSYGSVRSLNPMILACAIQSCIAAAETRLQATAFLEVGA